MLGFFLLFLPVALITESSIIPLEMVFEHRMYLPSFALAGLLGFACLAFLENAKPQRCAASAAAAAVVVLLLVSATDKAVAKWKDNYTLWSHALKHAPMDPRVHDNLSFAFQERNQLDKALVHARRTVQLDPMFLTGLHNLGRLLQQKGDRMGAYEMYTRALTLKPDYGPAHFSLGMMYLEAGDHARANWEFARTLEYDPNHSEAKRFYAYTVKAKDKGAAPAHP
jgi:tetratricopeptide (TPR) repeat protein